MDEIDISSRERNIVRATNKESQVLRDKNGLTINTFTSYIV